MLSGTFAALSILVAGVQSGPRKPGNSQDLRAPVPSHSVFRQVVGHAFMQNGFVPTLTPRAPETVLEIVYNNRRPVMLGNEFTPTEVRQPPSYLSWPTKNDTLYTLVFIDGDVKDDASGGASNYLHWLVYNIPGNDVASGDVLADYFGSAPPPEEGYHRYTYIVFEQPARITPIPKLEEDSQKLAYNLRKFLADNRITRAVGGNFYRATCDDWCREFWRTYTG